MGRPRHAKPPVRGTSRRDFFKRSGAGTVAVASLGGFGPIAVQAADIRFDHGVASGDPLSDRVILWTRVTPPAPKAHVPVTYVVAADPELHQVVARGLVRTSPAIDYTVKVDVTGLLPATTYYYRFMAEGRESPIGRTKTLPVGRTERLRMAVVSCSNHAYGFFNAYARIAQRADLDLVMHLGDYIYEYGAGQYGTVRTPEPPSEILTLADYRMRHAQYKRDPDSQAMHRQHPLVAIWDDHETANNAYQGGAENHQPETEGTWAARVDAALQAYYEWMPVRVVEGADLRRINRIVPYGDLADLFMLEERLEARSKQLGTNIGSPAGYFTQSGAYLDPSRQLLGADEESWLFSALRDSRARWKSWGRA